MTEIGLKALALELLIALECSSAYIIGEGMERMAKVIGVHCSEMDKVFEAFFGAIDGSKSQLEKLKEYAK